MSGCVPGNHPKGHDREPLLRFLAVLMRGKYPRTVPALSAEAGVARATGYRYIRDLECYSVLPIVRAPDPTSTSTLCGVDWKKLRAMS